MFRANLISRLYIYLPASSVPPGRLTVVDIRPPATGNAQGTVAATLHKDIPRYPIEGWSMSREDAASMANAGLGFNHRSRRIGIVNALRFEEFVDAVRTDRSRVPTSWPPALRQIVDIAASYRSSGDASASIATFASSLLEGEILSMRDGDPSGPNHTDCRVNVVAGLHRRMRISIVDHRHAAAEPTDTALPTSDGLQSLHLAATIDLLLQNGFSVAVSHCDNDFFTFFLKCCSRFDGVRVQVSVQPPTFHDCPPVFTLDSSDVRAWWRSQDAYVRIKRVCGSNSRVLLAIFGLEWLVPSAFRELQQLLLEASSAAEIQILSFIDPLGGSARCIDAFSSQSTVLLHADRSLLEDQRSAYPLREFVSCASREVVVETPTSASTRRTPVFSLADEWSTTMTINGRHLREVRNVFRAVAFLEKEEIHCSGLIIDGAIRVRFGRAVPTWLDGILHLLPGASRSPEGDLDENIYPAFPLRELEPWLDAVSLLNSTENLPPEGTTVVWTSHALIRMVPTVDTSEASLAVVACGSVGVLEKDSRLTLHFGVVWSTSDDDHQTVLWEAHDTLSCAGNSSEVTFSLALRGHDARLVLVLPARWSSGRTAGGYEGVCPSRYPFLPVTRILTSDERSMTSASWKVSRSRMLLSTTEALSIPKDEACQLLGGLAALRLLTQLPHSNVAETDFYYSTRGFIPDRFLELLQTAASKGSANGSIVTPLDVFNEVVRRNPLAFSSRKIPGTSRAAETFAEAQHPPRKTEAVTSAVKILQRTKRQHKEADAIVVASTSSVVLWRRWQLGARDDVLVTASGSEVSLSHADGMAGSSGCMVS
jgi:hypothetical protein